MDSRWHSLGFLLGVGFFVAFCFLPFKESPPTSLLKGIRTIWGCKNFHIFFSSWNWNGHFLLRGDFLLFFGVLRLGLWLVMKHSPGGNRPKMKRMFPWKGTKFKGNVPFIQVGTFFSQKKKHIATGCDVSINECFFLEAWALVEWNDILLVVRFSHGFTGVCCDKSQVPDFCGSTIRLRVFSPSTSNFRMVINKWFTTGLILILSDNTSTMANYAELWLVR